MSQVKTENLEQRLGSEVSNFDVQQNFKGTAKMWM